MRELMKHTPGWVIVVCGTLLLISFGGGFFYITVTGVDDTVFRNYFNTILNWAGVLLGSGSLVFAAAAQRQTNGNLDDRMKVAVKEATTEILEDDNASNQQPQHQQQQQQH